MFVGKRPLDGSVPSAGSILFYVVALPAITAAAFGLDIPREFQRLAMVLGIILGAMAYTAAARASARRRGIPFVTRTEATAYLRMWAVSQPVWRLLLLAIVPMWIGWTLFFIQYLTQRPLWMLGIADWKSFAVGSLVFGAIWTVMWFWLYRGRPQTDREPGAYPSRFLRL